MCIRDRYMGEKELKFPEQQDIQEKIGYNYQKVALSSDPLQSIELEFDSSENKQQALCELLKQWKQNPENQSYGRSLWQKLEKEATQYSLLLSEQLKSILEPQQLSCYKGDFKTGKRLNMKKVIPFIASNFRKDRIWMRRSEPDKRNYQILIALDNTLSMKENDVGILALQSLIILSLALAKIDVGEIGIAGISNGMDLLHDFQIPFTAEAAPYILSTFDFTYSSPDSQDLAIAMFLKESINLFKEKQNNESMQQICFIISDGKFNKKLVQPLLLEAEEENILYIFIIVDQQDKQNSILTIKSPELIYDENGKFQKVLMKNYLEDFPFKHYIILQHIQEISSVLVDILRQYFEVQSSK
eukprot:TRINITY_DN8573_c0_g1_i1.p1 TRINITY_DN8573_c0_g1~~TRINITY_DN8573_c0_g1_i1.p1  ORF type:complete len:358 (-),score=60.19 TRINITY_DN8573_c0_g1_i1:182-1255(-)